MPSVTSIHKPGATPLFMPSSPSRDTEFVRHLEDVHACSPLSFLPDQTTPYDEFFGADEADFQVDILPVPISGDMGSVNTPADTEYTSMGSFSSEKHQGLTEGSILKPQRAFQSQACTPDDPHQSRYSFLGPATTQQSIFGVQPEKNARCSPGKNGSSMWEDALVEFDSWLASGAVDIVPE